MVFIIVEIQWLQNDEGTRSIEMWKVQKVRLMCAFKVYLVSIYGLWRLLLLLIAKKKKKCLFSKIPLACQDGQCQFLPCL